MPVGQVLHVHKDDSEMRIFVFTLSTMHEYNASARGTACGRGQGKAGAEGAVHMTRFKYNSRNKLRAKTAKGGMGKLKEKGRRHHDDESVERYRKSPAGVARCVQEGPAGVCKVSTRGGTPLTTPPQKKILKQKLEQPSD